MTIKWWAWSSIIQPKDNSIIQAQQFSSIEEIVKMFGNKDLITEINILWYFANLQSTNRDTATQSVMIASSESFFLGKLEALKRPSVLVVLMSCMSQLE